MNFILDTGSGGISLDSTTAEYFKLKRVPVQQNDSWYRWYPEW